MIVPDQTPFGIFPMALVMSGRDMRPLSEIVTGDTIVTAPGVAKVLSIEPQLDIVEILTLEASGQICSGLGVTYWQPILISDWRVRYFFGFAHAYIHAWNWIEQGAHQHHSGRKTDWTVKLVVSDESAIWVQGRVWLATHRLKIDLERQIPLLSDSESKVLFSYDVKRGGEKA